MVAVLYIVIPVAIVCVWALPKHQTLTLFIYLFIVLHNTPLLFLFHLILNIISIHAESLPVSLEHAHSLC